MLETQRRARHETTIIDKDFPDSLGVVPGQPSPEIMAARKTQQPASQLPTIASNAVIDILPSLGRAALDSEGGKIGFAYLPDAVCGEYREFFKICYQAEGRIWSAKVQIVTKDEGAVVPKNASLCGPAIEKLVAAR